ncbi:caspase family protein [Streptomyces pactum]|uniref:Caspase family protein n=1 Tax=Streptomyces pactum TaxID=68249 RepID=A0ABS0NJF3_9ACTN|nr:caspase family protein [Streptomyces pactum]MBH5335283.1 caspase family protein [Streptomyces pactum]
MAGGRLPDRAGSRALLVGVGTVREGGFDVLEYTDANLDALRDALCTGPDAVFAADRVRVLRSPERGEWYDELRRAAQETTDLLLFYFVGHGYRHALENVLYLLAPGADLDGDLGGTALRWSLIPDTVGKGKVRRAVFILDCCYSGMAADQHAGSGERGHYVLASVPRTRTQPSEPLPNGRSPFTDAIVTAMARGGAAEAGGLTLHELFGRLDEVMRDWPAPHVTDGWGPRNGSGGDGPDILLTRRVRTGADGGAGAGPGPGPGPSAGAVGGGGVPGEAPAGAAPPGPAVGGTAPTGAAVDGHPVTGTPVTGTAVAGITPDAPAPGPAAGDPPAADPAVTAGGPPGPTGTAPGGSGDPSTTPARPAQDPRPRAVRPVSARPPATARPPVTVRPRAAGPLPAPPVPAGLPNPSNPPIPPNPLLPRARGPRRPGQGCPGPA